MSISGRGILSAGIVSQEKQMTRREWSDAHKVGGCLLATGFAVAVPTMLVIRVFFPGVCRVLFPELM